MKLPSCECCPRITQPGSGTSLPFLPGAEKRLKEDLLDDDEDLLDMTKTRFVPPTFEVDTGEKEGHKAGYEVFYALKDVLEKEASQTKCFVFHHANCLKSVKILEKKNKKMNTSVEKDSNELADFIIFTSFAIIAIQVKAIKTGSPVVRYNKARKQLETFRTRLNTYIRDHFGANAEDVVHTIVCFPNIDSDVLEKEDVKDDWVAGSQNENTRRSKLAAGILEKIENLKTMSILNIGHPQTQEEQRTTIRIALTWLYGSRLFFGFHPTLYGAAKHIEDKLLRAARNTGMESCSTMNNVRL